MNTQMLYKWTVPVYPIDAQKAGAELERIAEKHGSLKPSSVVDESRQEGSILHKCFEWDDEQAAEKYRCRQAQDMIRNIVTVKIGQIDTLNPIRAFVSFRREHEYVPIQQVLNSSAMLENMLDAAMKELEAFHRKFAALDSLSELMPCIDRAVQKYKENTHTSSSQ